MMETAEDILGDMALAAANHIAFPSIRTRAALRRQIDRWREHERDKGLVAAAARADRERAAGPGYRRDLDG